MNTDIKNLAMDVHDRIRTLAYLMWESAGRQQNMALQYWLNAEQEVLRSMQAATDIMMSAKTPPQETEPQPTPLSVKDAREDRHGGDETSPEQLSPPATQAPTKPDQPPTVTEKAEAGGSDSPASARKTTPRKTTTRSTTRKKTTS